MKKTVLTFGLISGLIISVLMGGSLLLADKIGSGHSMVLGYTIMVASFLLIYFGIRSYRDNTLAGQISFGRAFACGILITKTPSSTWPTPSWSPCPSALSLLSSPLPSSAAKPLSNPPPLSQS